MGNLQAFLSYGHADELLYGQKIDAPKPIRGMSYTPHFKLTYVSQSILKHYNNRYGLNRDDVYQLFEDIEDFKVVNIRTQTKFHSVFQHAYSLNVEIPWVCFRIAFNKLHPRECPLLADEDHVFLKYENRNGDSLVVDLEFLKTFQINPHPAYRWDSKPKYQGVSKAIYMEG